MTPREAEMHLRRGCDPATEAEALAVLAGSPDPMHQMIAREWRGKERVMADAPERIWAFSAKQTGYRFYARGPQPEFDNVEYIRADLALDPALFAEMVEALQDVAGGGLDVSHTALIFGCPEAQELQARIRAILAKLEANRAKVGGAA